MFSQVDLFGNVIDQPSEKSFAERYQGYISSAAWKRKASAAIQCAGGKCERCGITKYSAKLSVHHLTYDRFQRENLEDLKVLCPNCHEKADKERREKIAAKREQQRWDFRLEAWAEKVYGESWFLMDDELIEDEFDAWLETKMDY